MTLQEMARASGRPAKTVREMLHVLHEHGKIETGKVIRENIAGGRQPRPAYRLKAN